MKAVTFLFFASLLLAFAYIVFRRVVRRDFRDRGSLGLFTSMLQLLVFLGFFTFPYLFNPPDWPFYWKASDLATRAMQLSGFVLISLGFLIAFGTMAWFGIGKAFGVKVVGLTRTGPYRISRNPQILGGYLLVLGTLLQWPSIYGVGWAIMYAIITHWMVMTEEEHLSRVFGEEYDRYCAEVPRYLFRVRGLLMITFAVLLAGCQGNPGDAVAIDVGLTPADVQARLGAPQREQDFQLPEAPFFGPQEGLTDLVPPGTPVKEWVYTVGEEELYIWFAGAEGQGEGELRVIATGRYPAGAVY